MKATRALNVLNEIGPIPDVAPADCYVLDVAEAAFDFEMRPAVSRAVHTHPGPEIFYILTGEQRLETPDGAMRAGAGEGMVAPANTPTQLNITGSSKRDALFMIVHDRAKPWGMVSDWQPKRTLPTLAVEDPGVLNRAAILGRYAANWPPSGLHPKCGRSDLRVLPHFGCSFKQRAPN
jgi:quercetin dioxygenase-like cupin family protein